MYSANLDGNQTQERLLRGKACNPKVCFQVKCIWTLVGTTLKGFPSNTIKQGRKQRISDRKPNECWSPRQASIFEINLVNFYDFWIIAMLRKSQQRSKQASRAERLVIAPWKSSSTYSAHIGALVTSFVLAIEQSAHKNKCFHIFEASLVPKIGI